MSASIQSHKILFLILPVILLVMTFGVSPSFAVDQKTASLPAHLIHQTYHLVPGDEVNINVFGEPDLSGPYVINGQGLVSMPLIGSFQASTLTMKELETRVSLLLQDGYLIHPQVNVYIAASSPFYMVGEVHKPGRYDYTSGLNVSDAIEQAGGYTFRAKRKKVDILRHSPNRGAPSAEHATVLSVDPQEHNIEPGDIILVKERFF